MDYDRLRYFVTVAETSHIGRAAEILRITPAALSKAMRLFEDEMGVQLLLPAGRGITLTDKGRELGTSGRVLLQQTDELLRGLQSKDRERPFVVGTFEVFSTYFTGPCFKEMLPSGHRAVLRELTPGNLEQALVSRDIDLGITYIPFPRDGVHHVKVSEVSMGIFGRKDQYGQSGFADLPFVVPELPLSGAPSKVLGLDGWPDNEMQRSVRYRVTLMETALELCRQGLAVGYFPAFVVRLHNEQVLPEYRLQELALPKGMAKQRHGIYLARRTSDPEDVWSRKFAKAIRTLTK